MQPKGRAAEVVHATSSRWIFLSFIDIFDARIRRIATQTSEASPIITIIQPCALGAGSRDVEARAICLSFHRFIHDLQRAIDERKPLTKLLLIDA
jgi:hypothetical protein